jgi:hypothetical protein
MGRKRFPVVMQGLLHDARVYLTSGSHSRQCTDWKSPQRVDQKVVPVTQHAVMGVAQAV